MNDMTTTGTALALPAPTDLQAMFRDGTAIDPLIARIEAEVRAHQPDTTTKKGRDAIASLAYKVARSKTALDDAGKALNEDARKQINLVDAARKKIRDRLDALRDEARKPLDAWEAAEAARQERDAAILSQLKNHGMTGHETSEAIVAKAGEIKAIVLPDDFGADRESAELQRNATMQALRNMYTAAQAREAEAAELARLRAEAAERAAREAEEQAAREEAARIDAFAESLSDHIAGIRMGMIGGQTQPYIILLRDLEERVVPDIAQTGRHADRLERQRVEAITALKEAQEAQRKRTEAEEAARADRERAEAAEKARQEAEARAADEIERARREAAQAVEQAQRAAAEAIEREQRAAAEREAQAERERQEAAARAQREAEEKAAAEAAEKERLATAEQRRETALADIEAALQAMADKATPRAIAEALMAGEIPHVQVML